MEAQASPLRPLQQQQQQQRQPSLPSMAEASNLNNSVQGQKLQTSKLLPEQQQQQQPMTNFSAARSLGDSMAANNMQPPRQLASAQKPAGQRVTLKLSFQKLDPGANAQHLNASPKASKSLTLSRSHQSGHPYALKDVADLTDSTWRGGRRVIPGISDKQPALQVASKAAQQRLRPQPAQAGVHGETLFGGMAFQGLKNSEAPPSSKQLDWGRPETGQLRDHQVQGSLPGAVDSSANESAALSSSRAQRPFEQVADLTLSSWENGHRVIPGITKLKHGPAVLRPIPTRPRPSKGQNPAMPAAAVWGGLSDHSPRMISLQDPYTGSQRDTVGAEVDSSQAASPQQPWQNDYTGSLRAVQSHEHRSAPNPDKPLLMIPAEERPILQQKQALIGPTLSAG